MLSEKRDKTSEKLGFIEKNFRALAVMLDTQKSSDTVPGTVLQLGAAETA